MHNKSYLDLHFFVSCRTQKWVALAMTFLFALTAALSQPALAQTYRVIHDFTGGPSGSQPIAGLTVDGKGNLYGTASNGIPGYCSSDCGVVFKMSPRNGNWDFKVLYSFAGYDDGAHPKARVVFGPDGALYGTTSNGAIGSYCYFGDGCGTVFRLQPPAKACLSGPCYWKKTLLHRFTFGYNDDGAHPTDEVVFDQAGNIYGTVLDGGYPESTGILYELSPSQGSWTETILYKFDAFGQYGGHMGYPYASLSFAPSGDLFGMTSRGHDNCGIVFQMSRSESGWDLREIFQFPMLDPGCESGGFNDIGTYLNEGWLIFDAAGNLYGKTQYAGPGGGGTVFELSPSNGIWNISILHAFTSSSRWAGGRSGLAWDADGNLYGTTRAGGLYEHGTVFKLTRNGDTWDYTTLHDFTSGSDGANPWSNVSFGTDGKLYGTAQYGGAYGNGVVWEITP